MTLALNQLNETEDIARRLVIAENARKMLAAWPQEHYNYRLNEVRQMLSLLDEAIADLRAANGDGRFDLSLTAFTDPPPRRPSRSWRRRRPRRSIEQLLVAARVADTASERTTLLETALAGLDRDAAALPASLAGGDARTATRWQFEAERRVDRAYQSLTTRIVAQADRQARAADVGSLVRLADTVRTSDQDARRPASRNRRRRSIAAVEARLDAARRLQLARDRWALRQPEFQTYRTAIQAPLDLLARLEPALEQIKSLAGNSPASLMMLRSVALQVLEQAGAIAPPEEFRAAHALLVSAVQLAGNAARIRHEATLADDIARAWDASSAAAGALMLGRPGAERYAEPAAPTAATVITPRRTRLVRVPDLHAFRHAIVGLSPHGGSDAIAARGSGADRRARPVS